MKQMSGFDRKRFIDLNEREENHLKCGICLNIFNNAVNSECGHTFCKQCIQDWLYSNHMMCPECRQVFSTRKRSNGLKENDNLVVIKNFVFNRNLKINAFISELKTKCDFDFNGCQEVLEFGIISSHLNKCEHRFCKICNTLITKTNEHNCFELMRNERNEWQLKYQKSEQTVKELTQKLENERKEWKQKLETNEELIQKLMENISYFEKEFKEMSDFLMTTTREMMALSQITDYILFGTFKSEAHSLHVFCDGLKVTFVSVNNTQIKLKRNILIPFMEIQELMYCSDNSFPVLIIKTNAKHCLKLQKSLYLGDNSPNNYKLDVNSNDPKHWYIIVVLKETIKGFNIRLTEYYSRLIEPQIKSQSIDLNKTRDLIEKAQNDSSNVTNSWIPDSTFRFIKCQKEFAG